MKLLNLMNTKGINWEKILTSPPFNLTIKRDREYLMFKYNQALTDFSLELSNEARGSIFREDENGQWICVRRAFDKFFNYYEVDCAPLDWDKPVAAYEKIDGSLISVWFDKNEWHISTSGTINGWNTSVHNNDISFASLFCQSLGCSWTHLTRQLDKNYCYSFELVSPLNKVVVSYDKPKIYALGQRNMKTMEEELYDGPVGADVGIYMPRVWRVPGFGEALSLAESSYLEGCEGLVVLDSNWNRVKIKREDYLEKFYNKNLTPLRIIELLFEGRSDDIENWDGVIPMRERIFLLSRQLQQEKNKILECLLDYENTREGRKAFAEMVNTKYHFKDYCMRLFQNPCLAPLEYLRQCYHTRGSRQILNLIELGEGYE